MGGTVPALLWWDPESHIQTLQLRAALLAAPMGCPRLCFYLTHRFLPVSTMGWVYWDRSQLPAASSQYIYLEKTHLSSCFLPSRHSHLLTGLATLKQPPLCSQSCR